MLPSVFVRATRDQRRSLMFWSLAVVALVALYVAMYPSVKGSASYAKLIDQMPKAYRALFTTGTGADLSTPAGYLNTELLTFMGPLLVLIYAIGNGASAIAGEEERGTLDLLLANPVSRTRVLLEKLAALVAGVAAIVAALWVAVVGEGAAAGMHLSVGRSAAAMLHLGLLGVEFGALALLVGGLTGRLTVSRAVPALVAVAAYLVNGFAPLVGWLRPIRPVSPFYQYIGHDPLRTGLWPGAVGVTVAVIAVLAALAAGAFRRRDVLT